VPVAIDGCELRHRSGGSYSPSGSYYNQDTRNLRFGHANDPQFDPYAGTVWENFAPY
jgi:hypothetical protein